MSKGTTAANLGGPNSPAFAVPEPASPHARDDDKSLLRRRMRALAPDPLPDPGALVSCIDAWLRDHPELRTIAIFAALPGEPDLLPLLALHPSRRWVFPRVVGDGLCFHLVREPGGELVKGAFGVREPADELEVVDPREIDAFLCPGLAFDRHGGRLGRGRGFYDRALATARPGAVRIGVAFDHQLIDEVPTADHDIRMDEILSPDRAPRAGTRESV